MYYDCYVTDGTGLVSCLVFFVPPFDQAAGSAKQQQQTRKDSQEDIVILFTIVIHFVLRIIIINCHMSDFRSIWDTGGAKAEKFG